MAMLGRPAGDLHWERKEAGVYETMMYANGYLYRVVNRNKDYGPPGEWTCWYKWSGKKGMDWKRFRGGYSNYDERMRDAKERCRKHNMNPRAKYKFMGVVTQKDVDDRTYISKYLGFLVYKQVDRDGTISRYGSVYLDPKTIGGVDQEQANADRLHEQQIKANAELFRMMNDIVETEEKRIGNG